MKKPKQKKVVHEFVDHFPTPLDTGKLYISMLFASAAHLCCCGCGHEIITPISPAQWHLIYDGTSVSLNPSIGNWSLECQSHYWIVRNEVHWADTWNRKKIERFRAVDREALIGYYGRICIDGGREPF